MHSNEFENSSDAKKVMKALKFFLIALGIICLIIALGFVVMFLWNNTIAVIFSVSTISYWQAVGLFLLAKLFFGMSGNSNNSDRSSKKERMKMKIKERVNEHLDENHFSSDADFKEFWKSEGKEAYDAYLVEKNN